MNEPYDHKSIEEKWRKKWQEDAIYKSEENSDKPKYYCLDMFPYPSGEGLHVGHPKGYIATDIISRYKKMNGFNVLHPMGWDAFGLPAENYAIKNKIHPRIAVEQNIKRFKEQLEVIGFSYDWDKEINTTDPEYYKWTQWTFIKMFEKGLAYESFEPINWCASCKTGLANEDVEDGKCERCGTIVEKKPMRQWVLKIREYADRLLNDLPKLDWPEPIKESQRNWIGRSEGSEIDFKIKNSVKEIKVFTTRADTLFGVTYMILAPEHTLVDELKNQIENFDEVIKYRGEIKNKSEIERTAEGREKTGIEIKGIKAINPASNEEISVWIADYVLADYGTGAIMAVPGHDDRDYEFSQKFYLPLIKVIKEGKIINSGQFNDLEIEEAKKQITAFVKGEMKVNYKLRDWVFSRQRYWGEPIPIIHCGKCGAVPVDEKDLPVKLPEVESYEPTGTGESPLANISEWVNTKCPKCNGEGKRETNTMPQWAGSSWYYLRYIDAKNTDDLVDKEKEKYWSPVDLYVGGAEHATRHLIYARFWHKFLFDIRVVNYDEPFKKLQHVGLINAIDGRKMSKRWGNVINPDEIVNNLGADTLRVYEMFMGPFDQSVNWSEDGVVGPRRFLERVWRLQDKVSDAKDSEEVEKVLHKTIKKVTEDIERLNFNTAISQMMIFTNKLEEQININKENYIKFIIILAPFAPHMTDEIYSSLSAQSYLYNAKWPKYDESKVVDSLYTIGVQIDGKVRGTVEVEKGKDSDFVKNLITNNANFEKWLDQKNMQKFIYVEGKIVSIVTSE